MASNHNPALRAFKSATSASYLYPLKGIYYFATHPQFYSLLGRRLLPLLAVSIVVLGLLFTFAYLPQVAFMALFHGYLAFFNAIFLVLGEGQIIIALLFEALLVDETLVNVFDATLIEHGLSHLVAPSRLLDPSAASSVKQLGKPTMSAVYSPFSFRQILEFMLFLPLNFIPLIGTPAFLLLTGARGGPLHHYRYFKLKGYSRKDKRREVRERKWKYTWFGTMALTLQLIPVFSMFFLLSTACGSALWVVNLESDQERQAEITTQAATTTTPNVSGILDDDAVEAYTDV